jgi:hypothetical protein
MIYFQAIKQKASLNSTREALLKPKLVAMQGVEPRTLRI